jgi:hypothetical protein
VPTTDEGAEATVGAWRDGPALSTVSRNAVPVNRSTAGPTRFQLRRMVAAAWPVEWPFHPAGLRRQHDPRLIPHLMVALMADQPHTPIGEPGNGIDPPMFTEADHAPTVPSR